MHDMPADMGDALLKRVYSEFLEMPGLRLSIEQAQRLWGLNDRTCRELLDFLVDARFLCQTRSGMYTRSTEGLAEYPQPRAVTAQVPGDRSVGKKHVV